MMNALVTGATGFIGRRLVRNLTRRGDKVTCLIRSSSNTASLRTFPVQFVIGELGDPASLIRAVADKDYIFHLAGVIQAVHEQTFEAINTEGTRNLVSACLQSSPGIKRFVFVSSIAAAGPNQTEKPVSESQEARPVSAYGRSKIAAERIVLEAGTEMPATATDWTSRRTPAPGRCGP